MTKPPVDRFPFAKTVVAFAVAFVIGMGLCGLDYLLAANGIGKSTEEFGVGPLDALSLVVMAFSAVCLLSTLIAWFITAIVSSAVSTGDEETPHTLLNLNDKVSQSENGDHKADDTNIDKQK
jgi:hypothetical protein